MALRLVFNQAESLRLDQFLLRELIKTEGLKDLTRSQLQYWIKAGQVKIGNRAVTKPGYELKRQAVLDVVVPAVQGSDLAPWDFKLEVLYEDEALLVLNKPAGVSMHPGAGNREHTLVNALLQHYKTSLAGFSDPLRPGIVHRLDKGTSGVIVVARDVVTQHALAKQFSARSVGRAYYALVYTPAGRAVAKLKDQGSVEGNIGRHPKQRKLMTVLTKGGKAARTHWQVIERFPCAALLQLKLETGRTHQIRVHMAHLGFPLIGDPVYGRSPALPDALRRAAKDFGRQALHTFRLEFDHPRSGKRLYFEVPLPEDFKALIETFRGGL